MRCISFRRLTSLFMPTFFRICWADGAHSTRYTPYSPNSGFYYVRNNDRTRYFFEVFMRLGDQIMGTYFDQYSFDFFQLKVLRFAAQYSLTSIVRELTRSVGITSISYEL